jgi:hypothetical protein
MSTTNDTYRLCMVKRAALAAPADLTATLDWIVRALEAEDPILFSLFAYSPAMEPVRILDGDESRVEDLLATSEITWNFGREPADPTHEVVLFNKEEGARRVYLRASFVAGGAEHTGPGFVFDLRLGRDAAGPEGPERGAHLAALFSMLVAPLHPDFGHVELPGQPHRVDRPATYEVGWLTYFARAERPLPPALPPPGVMVPVDTGTELFAIPGLAFESHGDVAREIGAVRDLLAVRTRVDASPRFPPPLVATSPDELEHGEEDEASRTLPLSGGLAGGPALPFAPVPSGPRLDATPFHPPHPPNAPRVDATPFRPADPRSGTR